MGESGEEVVTNLQAKGLVFLRYGVEDVIRMTEEPCPCGRTHDRATILGRTIWLIDIRGKKIMPIDIQRIFEEFPETAQAAFTILKKAESMAKLEIRASFDKNITTNPLRLKSQIEERIGRKLEIESEIEWIPYEQLPKQFAKIMRITELK